MAGDAVEWVIVRDTWNHKEIGALGFIGDKVAIVAAFYDDYDANQDGKVSLFEKVTGKIFPIRLKDKEVVHVAMQSLGDPDVLMRDPAWKGAATHLMVNFAHALIMDCIYATYFSRSIGALAKPIANRLTENLVLRFVVRKGMEKAVRTAYNASTDIVLDQRVELRPRSN